MCVGQQKKKRRMANKTEQRIKKQDKLLTMTAVRL